MARMRVLLRRCLKQERKKEQKKTNSTKKYKIKCACKFFLYKTHSCLFSTRQKNVNQYCYFIFQCTDKNATDNARIKDFHLIVIFFWIRGT
jgi:hypothetical protein